MESKYRTKQRDVVIEALKKYTIENGIGANEFVKILADEGLNVSRATIYRRLKMLESDKIVRVYMGDDGEKRYEYIDDDKCREHMHLVCRKCDKTYHIDCDSVNNFLNHIEKEHNFAVDKMQTVIYGICDECK